MFRSLAFKWTATLIVASLIGIVLAGLFAYRSTITEYDRLRSDQARDLFIQNIITYYEISGTWQGLDEWLPDEPEFDDRLNYFRPPEQFALADMTDVIVIGHGPFHVGELVSPSMIEAGTPLMVDDRQVGTVLRAQPPPELDPREQRYLEGITQALLVGAVGASAAAMVIGLLLSRQFLRPLSELTQAITAMHAGELDQRVNIRTRDELGILAHTFNEMSANLSRANQLRKQMTADIAHDLRTPLTVIAGYLEALRDGTLKPTPERFRVMAEEVSMLNRLIEDLRMLSLADAGELKLMRSLITPAELLQRVAAAFQESAAASSITLTAQASPDIPEIAIDNERMVQVLGNLVVNALRHTPSGGIVTLHALSTADSITLRVSDTGSGIEPDDLPRIFDRFYRADPSRQSDSGESGLGLAIARSIVEAHGGTIAAESTVGLGTTITITLPHKSSRKI